MSADQPNPVLFYPPDPLLSRAYVTFWRQGNRATLECVCGRTFGVRLINGTVWSRDAERVLRKHAMRCGRAQG